MALLPAGALASGCSSTSLATKGQLITCTTDPGTGEVLRCAPGGGDGSGSGSNTCQDVDEDGDGEPHDQGDDTSANATGTTAADDSGDRDRDGVPDDRDCDERPGEDGDRGGLPYDIRPKLGSTTRPILDAFAERTSQPPQIVSVTMDGGTWRLTELQAGTAFVVTQDDCHHAGNRWTGRDRVVVTWTNTDQTRTSDHLDIRYCDAE